ncbi:hypothetical protein BYT27DRAFT_6808199 [Phlegmacium glaucopus]|nr:hypothetical protein BYT27DRAFT_6808199 [Phlegmacium glaucopus]
MYIWLHLLNPNDPFLQRIMHLITSLRLGATFPSSDHVTYCSKVSTMRYQDDCYHLSTTTPTHTAFSRPCLTIPLAYAGLNHALTHTRKVWAPGGPVRTPCRDILIICLSLSRSDSRLGLALSIAQHHILSISVGWRRT